MKINDQLINCLGKKFETLCDSMMFRKGTIIEIKSIDIRKLFGSITIRFRCIINGDKNDDAYLKANEFIGWIGIAIKEVK